MAEIFLLDAEEIPGRACELVCQALGEAVRANGHGRFAIAGGSATSPLATIRESLGEDWQSIRLTWVDERCVDKKDADSNRGTVYRQGGLTESQPPERELPLWLDGETTAECKKRVESALRDDFHDALDVALLGMGPDGHIASLFPDHPALADSGAANVVHIADSPKPPSQRMTLTLSFLRKTSHNVLIATGEAKRDALRRLAAGDPSLPTSALSNLIVLTNIDLSKTEAST